jgi:protein gp37
MADQRDGGIAWTDVTWNPVRGCSRVSPGCENCYAERTAARFSGTGQPYHGLAVMGEHRPRWTGEVRLVPEHLADPLRWRRPRRVFVNSMSDLFHEKLANEEIAAVFGVMAAAQAHTFQVLTKRPERMREWFEWVVSVGPSAHVLGAARGVRWYAWDRLGSFRHPLGYDDTAAVSPSWSGEAPSWPWPLPNVWLGVTAEDQRRADERLPLLLQTPAAVRFVSVEPQLEHVFFQREWIGADRVYWVIGGAESGPGARPFNEAWARSLRDQCQAFGAAFFYKQTVVAGRKVSTPDLDGRRWVEFPR